MLLRYPGEKKLISDKFVLVSIFNTVVRFKEVDGVSVLTIGSQVVRQERRVEMILSVKEW